MPSIPLETKEIQQEEPGEFANEAVDAWEGWRSYIKIVEHVGRWRVGRRKRNKRTYTPAEKS